jgi:hypothetical protein
VEDGTSEKGMLQALLQASIRDAKMVFTEDPLGTNIIRFLEISFSTVDERIISYYSISKGQDESFDKEVEVYEASYANRIENGPNHLFC